MQIEKMHHFTQLCTIALVTNGPCGTEVADFASLEGDGSLACASGLYGEQCVNAVQFIMRSKMPTLKHMPTLISFLLHAEH